MTRRSYMAQSAARRPGAGPHAPARHLRGRGAGWLADWEQEQEDRVNILEPATSTPAHPEEETMEPLSIENAADIGDLYARSCTSTSRGGASSHSCPRSARRPSPCGERIA